MTYQPTRANTASWWVLGQPVLVGTADIQTTPSAPSGSSSLLPPDEISYGASGLMYASVPITVQLGGVTLTSGVYNPSWILVRDTVVGLTWAICPFATADIQAKLGMPAGLPTSCTAYCTKHSAQVVLPPNTVGFTNTLLNLTYTNLVATTPAAAVAGSGNVVLPNFSNPDNANIRDFRDGVFGSIGAV